MGDRWLMIEDVLVLQVGREGGMGKRMALDGGGMRVVGVLAACSLYRTPTSERVDAPHPRTDLCTVRD